MQFGFIFILFVIISLIFLFFLILNLKPNVIKIPKNPDPESDWETLKLFAQDIQTILINSLRQTHFVIADRLPYYLDDLLWLVKQIYKLKQHYFLLVFLFIYLPRLIVSLTFLVDIFHFNKFDYFYKVLILLIIPIIFQAILGIFRQAYDLNLNKFNQVALVYQNEFLSVLQVGTKTNEEIIRENFQINSFEEFKEKFFDPLTMLPEFLLDPIDKIMLKSQKKIALITYFCYLIGWGYIIFHGFF